MANSFEEQMADNQLQKVLDNSAGVDSMSLSWAIKDDEQDDETILLYSREREENIQMQQNRLTDSSRNAQQQNQQLQDKRNLRQ